MNNKTCSKKKEKWCKCGPWRYVSLESLLIQWSRSKCSSFQQLKTKHAKFKLVEKQKSLEDTSLLPHRITLYFEGGSEAKDYIQLRCHWNWSFSEVCPDGLITWNDVQTKKDKYLALGNYTMNYTGALFNTKPNLNKLHTRPYWIRAFIRHNHVWTNLHTPIASEAYDFYQKKLRCS